jgi:hypothetical protein
VEGCLLPPRADMEAAPDIATKVSCALFGPLSLRCYFFSLS